MGGGGGLVEARTYCDLCRESNEPCPPDSNNFPPVNFDMIRVKTEPVESEHLPTRFPIEERSKKAHSLANADSFSREEERSKNAHSLDNENALSHKELERQQKPHICSQPQPDPIWRGSMIIENRNWKLNGLVAHSSTLACSKVHNVTNSLPESLRMEILPRLAIWPKRFGSRALQDTDIGIYFFPENKSEKDFENLLDDMIWRDTAVKTSFDFADLLIFTSHHLPSQHRRYQNKHYLWGLFSREKFSSKSI